MESLGRQQTHELLAALGEQLAARDARVDLVVIGGSALLALGLTSRATRDVDVVGLLAAGSVVDPRPLPKPLLEGVARVARDFALPSD
jgi:hypothetical protein